MAEDRTLTCKECGHTFTFTAGEQEFYSQKGFQHDPARCPACRRARKAARSQMYNMSGMRGGYAMYRTRHI
ncbi:MAG TPA: zinc-ribbon domain-containing protein [Armatimonadota bacterium]|nr:zinc-ribbon domain-containing protein [Armatimonadota bacterium]